MRGFFLLLVVAGCGSQPSTAAITFDPCTQTLIASPTANAEQQASIDDAIAMWRARGVTGLERGDIPAVTVAFRDAADVVHGFYDDTNATVYVNVRLQDRAQRAITIAHELGHAFGLVHISAEIRPSVMNTGNVTIAPTDRDEGELATLWGACQ